MIRSACLVAGVFLLAAAAACPAAGDAVTLVMLGDSVTASRSAPEGQKVPQVVERALNAHFAGRVRWTVVNAGVGSESAQGGLARAAGVLSREKPRFVSLAYGLNDCGRKDPKWFETQMSALLDAAQKPARDGSKPQVVLLTATPFINEKHAWGKDAFFVARGGLDAFLDREINRITRRLAAERRLPLVDVHRAFVGTPRWEQLMQGDGVHPTSEGNRVLGEYVAQVLGAYCEAQAGGKGKEGETKARAKLDEAKKAVAAGRKAEARTLLLEAGRMAPWIAEVWAGLDEIETQTAKP